MNNNSRETLRRVTQNDPSLTALRISSFNTDRVSNGEFYSDNSDDYSTLGAAIANNTHLERLAVLLSDDLPLGVADREFCNGLKANSSISDLELYFGGQNIAGGIGQEILKVYQENNSQLTFLGINDANLQNGGDRVIVVGTLRSCRNLQKVTLHSCSITDEQLLPIIDAIRGHLQLKELRLGDNNIGNAGCNTIATLLTDPNCNLHTLDLGNNAINNKGATTIANSLSNNNKLQQIYLHENQIDQSVQDVFSNILCNKSSINNIHSSSNHALERLSLVDENELGQQLESLLELNRDANKNHVAIKKILQNHSNIDMEPFFEWGMEEEGEQNLKALPHVVNWFEKARVAVAEGEENYHFEEKKLSAILQFALAMPLLLEGIARYDTH